MNKVRFCMMSAVTTTMAAVAFSISSAMAATLEDGVYTAEQAEAGKEVFERRCSACHNADFYRVSLANRNGQPLTWMFEEILGTMPADMPGSLSDAEYESILAHILELTGFPAGEKPLDYASGSMDGISVVPPSA